MSITLEKIDQVKERTGSSYKEAKAALEAVQGDVVEAVILLEEREKNWINQGEYREAINRFREILKKSSDTRIKVKSREKTVADIPAPLGAAGALVFPKAAAVGTLLLLFTRYSLHLDKRSSEEKPKDQEDQPERPEGPVE